MGKKKAARRPSDADVVDDELSFEDALAAVEDAVEQLESGDVDLSEALATFEEGVRHLKICYRRLQEAERRIERLTGVDAEGNPITEPFDDQELTLNEKQQARSRRRSDRAASETTDGRRRIDEDGALF